MDRFGSRLVGVARSLMSTEEDADDVVQEAWMIALDYPKLPPDEEAGSWLYTIVIRVARSRTRTAKRRRHLIESTRKELPSPARLEGPEIEVSLLFDAVNEAIGELSSLQRSVLLYRIVDGLSTIETAKALNRAEGTVMASLRRAVETLKDRFGDDLREALGSISVPRSKKGTGRSRGRWTVRSPPSAQARDRPPNDRDGETEQDHTSTKEDSNENSDE